MKYIIFFLSLNLLVTGCAKRASVEDTPVPVAPTTNESVGTRGGGGTLVSTFKQASEAAHLKMIAVDLPFANTPENELKNNFYKSIRNQWIETLARFANDATIVGQSQDTLTDLGLVVGAKSLPTDNPTHVLLSEPYLNAGFSSDQAFVLAVHEAAHFVYPNMSEGEHAMLDQIGIALLKK